LVRWLGPALGGPGRQKTVMPRYVGRVVPSRWRGPTGPPARRPALRTARLPRWTVVLSIARTRKKDEIMAWLQPYVEQRLAESDVILEAIDART